jgi:DNA-binding transcriptional LysR family regulator
MKIHPTRKFSVIDAEMLIEATSDGLGYAIVPQYAMPTQSGESKLVKIFTEYELAQVPFSLLDRSRNLHSAAQRAVVDAIVSAFQ